MSVLKEYIKRILKEELSEEDFVVLWDWWLENYPKMGLQIKSAHNFNRRVNYKILSFENKDFAPFIIDAQMVVWNYEQEHSGPVIPRTLRVIYKADPKAGYWKRPEFNYYQSPEQGPVLDFNGISSLEEAIDKIQGLINIAKKEAKELKIYYDKEQTLYSNLTKIKDFVFNFLENKVPYVGKEETKERSGGFYYSHFISQYRYAWKKKLRGKRKLVINLHIDDRDFPTLFEVIIFDKGAKRTIGKIEFNFQNPINFNETQKEIIKILSSAAIHQ